MLALVIVQMLIEKPALFRLTCLVTALCADMWDAVVCMMHTSILLYTYPLLPCGRALGTLGRILS